MTALQRRLQPVRLCESVRDLCTTEEYKALSREFLVERIWVALPSLLLGKRGCEEDSVPGRQCGCELRQNSCVGLRRKSAKLLALYVKPTAWFVASFAFGNGQNSV